MSPTRHAGSSTISASITTALGSIRNRVLRLNIIWLSREKPTAVFGVRTRVILDWFIQSIFHCFFFSDCEWYYTIGRSRIDGFSLFFSTRRPAGVGDTSCTSQYLHNCVTSSNRLCTATFFFPKYELNKLLSRPPESQTSTKIKILGNPRSTELNTISNRTTSSLSISRSIEYRSYFLFLFNSRNKTLNFSSRQ